MINKKLLVTTFLFACLSIYLVNKGNSEIKLINKFQHTEEYCKYAFLSDDNKYLLTGSRKVCLWNHLTGEKLQELDDNTNCCLYAAVFSPSSKRVATADLSCNVRVWDIESKRKMYTFNVGTIIDPKGISPNPPSALAFTNNDNILAGANVDGYIKFWDLGTGDEIYELCPGRSAKMHFLMYGINLFFHNYGVSSIFDLSTKSVVYEEIKTDDGGRYCLSKNENIIFKLINNEKEFFIEKKNLITNDLNKLKVENIPDDIINNILLLNNDTTLVILYKTKLGFVNITDGKKAKNDYKIQDGQEIKSISKNGKYLVTESNNLVFLYDISDLTSGVNIEMK